MLKRFAALFKLPVYPFLVTLFPVVVVFTSNFGLTHPDAAILLTCVILSATCITWFLLNLSLKDKHKSGILTSVIILLCLTYGSIYVATEQLVVFGFSIHKHRYVMLMCITIVLFTYKLVKRRSPETTVKLGRIASVVSLLLLAIPFFTLLSSFRDKTATFAPEKSFVHLKSVYPKTNLTYPDVYYFILDGYGREEILQKRLGYSNTLFIKELEKRGFYVAKNSYSNYSQTTLSVTSSLNMDYLQNLAPASKHSLSYFSKMLKNNAVIQNFNDLGYTTINTVSGYDFTSTLNTDLTINPAYTLSEFESAVYNNSIFPFLFNNDLILKLIQNREVDFIQPFLYEQHRKKINVGLKQSRNLVLLPGKPVMAFIHILLAHPPFVFNHDGKPVTPKYPFALILPNNFTTEKEYQAVYAYNYKEQVEYGNKELLKTIDAIKSVKNRRSVIILQGDHGPWSKPNYHNMRQPDYAERMSILNAMYFPDSTVYDQLYPEISPVNTFRLIFNNYFNAGYKLKKDKAFYSDYDKRFEYKDVTYLLVTDTHNKPSK